MSSACPCGLAEPYPQCCGRFHSGAQTAPTAERLMRSRYAAFAMRDAAYLLRTWHPRTRPGRLRLDPQQRWTGLTILDRSRGGLLDQTGTVEFEAAYRLGGRPGTVRERSQFARHDGLWTYLGPAAP